MYLQDIYTIYLENKYKKIIIKFYIKSNLNIYQFKISNLFTIFLSIINIYIFQVKLKIILKII